MLKAVMWRKIKQIKMWKSIDISKLDELLENYNRMKNEGKTFSKFIEVSGLVKDDGLNIPDWDWVDSIGVVTPEDFGGAFDKEFVEEHFEELADLWFKGINSQVDFGIVLECIKEEIAELKK